tara:strand:+ start:1085 stop:1810 length:726 start_codon:yes stop_codon:yes gene_type:complete
MKHLFSFILSLVDFFYQRKIINFFKKNLSQNIEVLLDIGSHNGESIKIFLKNFNLKNIYSFEASALNYEILEKNIKKMKKKYINCNINIFNVGVGNSDDEKIFYDLSDSNSSTFNKINKDSLYFKRKNKILSFFFKKNFFVREKLAKQICLSDFIDQHKLKKIDILKIDTEGYELEVLKGLGDKINYVKFIYFEHHYDNMIEKNYKFSHIHDLLTKRKFSRSYKIKMPFRKSFDYIYKKVV